MSAIKTIGFIGLGTMGAPMVRNLLKHGYEVIVYNRNAAKAAEFLAHPQAKVVSSPAEVAQRAELVVTMLANHQAIEDVYFADEGLVGGLEREGAQAKIVADCSTVAPEMSLRLAEALARRGIEFLDAPVTGSEPQAIEGVLTFLVGGKQETLDVCMDALLAMGKKAVFFGGNGAGANAKLANNTLAAINLLAVAESVRMIERSGGDPRLFLEAVAGGGARSWMAEAKGPKMLANDYTPNFSVALMHKDLSLAQQLAESIGLHAPLLELARSRYGEACDRGYAGEDVSAVYKLYGPQG